MSSIDTFAQTIKAKHPEYQDMDNTQLVQKVIAKYPQYSDMIDPGDRTLIGNLASTNGQGPVDELMGASKDVGGMVKGGFAGMGDIDASLSNAALGTNFNAPSLSNVLPQAASDVTNVENGQQPTGSGGKVGSAIGSLFTPNMIAAQGAAGAVAQPIADTVGNVATPVIKGLAKYAPNSLVSWLGGSPEAVSALAENPEAVATAQGLPEMASNVANKVQGVRQTGMAAATAGKEALSDTTPVVGLKDKLMNYAATLANSPGADAADKAAADYASEYAKNLDLNPSESDVNDLIEDLDSKINTKFNTANPNPTVEAKIAIRRTLSQALQAQNPAYAKAMAASTASQAPATALEKAFGVAGGTPSDRTISALINKSNPAALTTQSTLNTTIPGLSDQIRNAIAKNALQKSLLGNIGLKTAPLVNPAIQGGVQTVPFLGNAAAQTYNGLTQ